MISPDIQQKMCSIYNESTKKEKPTRVVITEDDLSECTLDVSLPSSCSSEHVELNE